MPTALITHILDFILISNMLVLCSIVIARYLFPKPISDRQNKKLLFIYSFFIAAILFPAIIYLINQEIDNFPLTIRILGIISLVITVLNYKNLLQLLKELYQDNFFLKEVLFSLLLAILCVLFFARLEQFLPEYDGYIHERVANLLLQYSYSDISSHYHTRPAFYFLVALLKHILPNCGLLITKYIFPATITWMTILAVSLFAKKRSGLTTTSLLLFSSPLFLSQTIYFRAQSVAIVLLPLILFELFGQERRNNVRLTLLFIISAIGTLFFHIFFAVLVLLFLTLFLDYVKTFKNWDIFKKRAIIIIVCLVIFNLFLLMRQNNGLLSAYINMSKIHLNTELFFIKHYAAPDIGLKYNFSNFDLAKYYIHHILYLGFIVGLAFIILRRSNYFPDKSQNLKGIWLVFLVYLVGTEILPRFGIQYDPERLWIFANIALIIIALILFDNSKKTNLAQYVIICSALISVATTAYFISKREKTFTNDDQKAIEFINTQQWQNSIIVTPEVKSPGVNLFKTSYLDTFIDFPGVLHYSNPLELESQLSLISKLDPQSVAKNTKNIQEETRIINSYLQSNQTLPAETISQYNQAIETLPSNQKRNILIYTCNNIQFCNSSGTDYQSKNNLLEKTGFLKKVFSNSTVTLYQFENTNLDLPKAPNQSFIEIIYKSSYELDGRKFR